MFTYQIERLLFDADGSSQFNLQMHIMSRARLARALNRKQDIGYCIHNELAQNDKCSLS